MYGHEVAGSANDSVPLGHCITPKRPLERWKYSAECMGYIEYSKTGPSVHRSSPWSTKKPSNLSASCWQAFRYVAGRKATPPASAHCSPVFLEHISSEV